MSDLLNAEYRELLIGCGNKRERMYPANGRAEWTNLTTIDHNPNCGADIIWDLDETPWPVGDCEFDEVCAFEVLEHLGQQGDWRAFFRHFGEIWRVLKPGGLLVATVPSWRSEWAWGDPSHTRVITPGTLLFLSRSEQDARVGKTAMTDFRHVWAGDFDILASHCDASTHSFVLQAVK
jgi:SAM-dependent methyltransferase